ncbi:MAG: ABC transporter permease [Chromatiales bacterium]
MAALREWWLGDAVVLWTDALLFVLLAVVLAFAWHARRREHMRAPWRQVTRSSLGMASAVVLLAYLAVALLDSLHFHPRLPGAGAPARYSPAVTSLFDVLAAPLREQAEESYAAPFATHLFTRETVDFPDGTQRRQYPRLKFGGAHLEEPAERGGDIARTALRSGIEAALLWAGLAALLIAGSARRQRLGWSAVAWKVSRGQSDIPWRPILITVLVVLVLAVLGARLGVQYHVFGTDKVGQDVFYQALKSIRTGLLIGTLTTLVMLPFAIALGVMAGYFRGLVDDGIQYLYTTLNSIPGVLLIAASVLMLQVYMANHADEFKSIEQRSDLRLLFLCIILGVMSWTGLCRLLRGEALKLREADYVQAARAMGVSHLNILGRHIVPNVMHIVMIAVVLDFSGLVLAEAVLSYISIGVDPSMQSWGNMINSARLELAREPVVWWSLAAAFLFMFVLVLAANLFADAVRDAFDPRIRKAR